MTDFSKAASLAFRFAADAKRIGFLAAFYLFFLVLVGALVFFTGLAAASLALGGSLAAAAGSVAGLLAGLLVVTVVFVLAHILVAGALIHNAGALAAGKPVGLRGSLAAAWKKLPSLVGASILVVAICVGFTAFALLASILFLFIPLANILWQLVVFITVIALLLALVFPPYQVMLAGADAVESVASSLKLFARKPLEVIIAFVIALVVVLASAVAGLAALLVAGGIGLTVFFLAKNALATAAAAGLAAVGVAAFLAAICFASLFATSLFASTFHQLRHGPAGPVTKGIKPRPGRKK